MPVEKDNLLGVIQTLFRWKRQIALVCGLAIVGSIGISLLLPDYFQAVTTFYATSSDQAKPAPVGPPLKERAYYGQDEDIDRILAIAQSGELVDYVIKRFHLFEHYDMDSTNAKAAYKLRLRFLKLYDVKKTKYESIELSVEDKDKAMAAAIANAARIKTNEIAQRLIKDNQGVQINSYKANIIEKNEDLREIGDSLSRLQERFHITDSETQGETLARLLAQSKSKLARNRVRYNILKKNSSVNPDSLLFISAMISGSEAEIENIEKEVKLFRQGVSPVKVLEEMLNEAREQISLDRETLKQLQGVYDKGFNAIITMEEAGIPPVKSRPKRSIIVIASALIAFIFSSIAVLLIDTYKHVNWREIING